MQKFYGIDKSTNKIKYICDSIALLKNAIIKDKQKETDFYILGDIDMKYVSRIVYVDGDCIYNNLDFWLNHANDILEDFENHEILDFLGNSVTKFRFETEKESNAARLSNIDGIAGEIDYNMTIGNELISLLREECIKTDLKEITPLQIAAKTAQIIPMLQTGSFREANQLISTLEPDEFFTEERLNKYSSMIAAADVIEYAK